MMHCHCFQYSVSTFLLVGVATAPAVNCFTTQTTWKRSFDGSFLALLPDRPDNQNFYESPSSTPKRNFVFDAHDFNMQDKLKAMELAIQREQLQRQQEHAAAVTAATQYPVTMSDNLAATVTPDTAMPPTQAQSAGTQDWITTAETTSVTPALEIDEAFNEMEQPVTMSEEESSKGTFDSEENEPAQILSDEIESPDMAAQEENNTTILFLEDEPVLTEGETDDDDDDDDDEEEKVLDDVGLAEEETVAPVVSSKIDDATKTKDLSSQLVNLEEKDKGAKSLVAPSITVFGSYPLTTDTDRATDELETPNIELPPEAIEAVLPTFEDESNTVNDPVKSPPSEKDLDTDTQSSKTASELDNEDEMARRREYFAKRIAESRQRALLISLANRKADVNTPSDKFNPVTVESTGPKMKLGTNGLRAYNVGEEESKWKPSPPAELQQRALLAERLAMEGKSALAKRGFRDIANE